jgi:transcriptional regulator with XRE-family HTH domain
VKRTDSYREFIERVESTIEYKSDVAALELVDELVRSMQLAGISQAELSRRIGASEPYVSKVLRGDANFTLATMVKLATAVGQEVHIHMAPPGSTVRWLDLIDTRPQEPKWPLPRLTRRAEQAHAVIGGVHATAAAAA